MVHNVPEIFTTEFAHKCPFSAMPCFVTLSMPESFTHWCNVTCPGWRDWLLCANVFV